AGRGPSGGHRPAAAGRDERAARVQRADRAVHRPRRSGAPEQPRRGGVRGGVHGRLSAPAGGGRGPRGGGRVRVDPHARRGPFRQRRSGRPHRGLCCRAAAPSGRLARGGPRPAAPMNLIDRYIARQYLTNIAALLVILSCFVVAIDVSLNLPRYWNQAVEMCRQSPATDTTLRRLILTPLLIMDLWWPRLLALFNFLLGLVLVGAMGFTCTQLVRHRELVAVLTAGQSLFRIARPIL